MTRREKSKSISQEKMYRRLSLTNLMMKCNTLCVHSVIYRKKLRDSTDIKVKDLEAKGIQTTAEIKKFYDWDMF